MNQDIGQEQLDDMIAASPLLQAREKFVSDYIESKGWPTNKEELTIDQILEIRSQEGWKHPTVEGLGMTLRSVPFYISQSLLDEWDKWHRENYPEEVIRTPDPLERLNKFLKGHIPQDRVEVMKPLPEGMFLQRPRDELKLCRPEYEVKPDHKWRR